MLILFDLTSKFFSSLINEKSINLRVIILFLLLDIHFLYLLFHLILVMAYGRLTRGQTGPDQKKSPPGRIPTCPKIESKCALTKAYILNGFNEDLKRIKIKSSNFFYFN